MNSIAEQKTTIDLADAITAEGVELKTQGNKKIGRCPFHNEKTPSFFVFADNRFKCFGCGESGDVIDFIQKLHGCSFKDALKHLGMDGERQRRPDRRSIYELKKARQEKRRYQQRESDLAYTLALFIRASRRLIAGIKSIEDLEANGEIMHALPFWKHCHSILCYGEPADRSEVVKNLKEIVTVDRGINGDFDFQQK
jgi:DNA primase